MPQCTICQHQARVEIEAALQAQTPLRNIAERFDIAKTTLVRHKAHMQDASHLMLSRAKELHERACTATTQVHVVQVLRGITALLKDLCEQD